jgi:hypothetical protein
MIGEKWRVNDHSSLPMVGSPSSRPQYGVGLVAYLRVHSIWSQKHTHRDNRRQPNQYNVSPLRRHRILVALGQGENIEASLCNR